MPHDEGAAVLERLDPRDLRRTFGCFATGVAIVTTRTRDGRLLGLTVNSLTSVSLDPPMLLWCLASGSPNLTAFLEAPAFAISVLGSDQADLCRRFAAYADDKFAGVAWQPGHGGAPVLEGAIASFECVRGEIVPAGDHHVFLGHIMTCRHDAGVPLIYSRGGFAVPAPLT